MNTTRLRRRTAAAALLPLLALTACGRADTEKETGNAAGQPAASAASSSDGSFGTLDEVCGGNDTGGATDQGVTADEIQVGVVSDIGFFGIPGLLQEVVDGSKVFSSWCNDQGGINGRKIKTVDRDAKLIAYKEAVTSACKEDFAFAGGFSAGDAQGVAERLTCLLPDFPAATVSDQSRGADLLWQANAQSSTVAPLGILRYTDTRFPGAGDAVGFLVANVPSNLSLRQQAAAAAKELGWKVVYDATSNPSGESTWVPFAQAIKSKGVKTLVQYGAPENLASLEKAMEQVGYYPDVILASPNTYDPSLLELGGSALKNTYLQSLNVPFEQADSSPALTRYLELVEQYAPDSRARSLLGVDAFKAWLLFAQAAKACGAELTRSCLAEEADKITAFDAGGLQGPANPAELIPSPCFTVVKAEDGAFTPDPDFKGEQDGFDCSDSNLFATPTKAKPVTLADVGKSISDLP